MDKSDNAYKTIGEVAKILNLKTNKKGAMPVFVGSLAASVIFFVISNFGVWASQAMYTKNAIGLLTCFEAAIPFFPNTLAADLFFSSLLFSSYAIIKKTNLVIAK